MKVLIWALAVAVAVVTLGASPTVAQTTCSACVGAGDEGMKEGD